MFVYPLYVVPFCSSAETRAARRLTSFPRPERLLCTPDIALLSVATRSPWEEMLCCIVSWFFLICPSIKSRFSCKFLV